MVLITEIQFEWQGQKLRSAQYTESNLLTKRSIAEQVKKMNCAIILGLYVTYASKCWSPITFSTLEWIHCISPKSDHQLTSHQVVLYNFPNLNHKRR